MTKPDWSSFLIKRLAVLAQIAFLLFFIYAQYHGLSFFGSDEEKPQPGTSRSSFHK